MSLDNLYIELSSLLNIAEKAFIDNVFIPVVGRHGLNFLKPQTPFVDSDGRNRRIDFTVESNFRKYAIEIDGYTYHAEGVITRDRFDDSLFRQNDLMLAGYTVLRFSYDQITRAPDQCQAQLRRAFVADEELNPLFHLSSIIPNIPQQDALDALEHARRAGYAKGLVVLATGIGKTYLAAFDAKRFCENSGGKVLFLVHNVEILKQSADKFANVWSNTSRGLYYGVEKVPDAQVIFASMQTMASDEHRMSFAPTHFEYIIIDESHRTATNSYRAILSYFTPKFLLGITATPDRLDEQEILPFYGDNLVFEMGQRQAIEDGFLVPFRYFGLKDNVDYSNIRYGGYRYNIFDLDKLLMIDKRDDAIIREFNERVPSKRGIGFCVSIKHAERCAEKFRRAGFSALAIHSQLDKEVRDERVRKFRTGQAQLAFVRDIFNEGVDFPDVEVLLFLRPTESKTIFIQQLGRGLRLSPRKEFVTVLDFIGNYKKANRVRAYLQSLQGSDSQQLDAGDKPEYNYPLGCEVHFDEEVIEIFKQQEGITKDDLLEAYIEVKERLGRQPTVTDINEYGEYAQFYYIKLFGSWNKFLESVGEIGNLSPEILTRAYYEVKEKLGRRPKRKEMEEHCSFSSANYNRFWGSWKKFLIAIGEAEDHNENRNAIPLEQKTDGKKRRARLPAPARQELIDEFLKLQAELGEQPSTHDVDEKGKYLASFYRKEFGSWKNFLEHLNLKPLQEKATEKELIAEYLRVKEKLGRQPSATEMEELSKFSKNTYRNRWGTWANFINSLGEEVQYKVQFSSKEELIQEYFKVKQQLGRVPTLVELTSHGRFNAPHYQNRFGGFRNFLKEIGEQTIEEQLIDKYIAVREQLGRQPTAKEFTKYSDSSWATIAKYFGSWNDFLVAVGETPIRPRGEQRGTPKRNVGKQDLIEAYYRLKEKLGRRPLTEDVQTLGEFSVTAYRNHFGTWNKFLESIGEPVFTKEVSTDDLIAAYYELKESLGRIPTGTDMDKHGKYSSAVYYRRFGGWPKFLAHIGENKPS